MFKAGVFIAVVILATAGGVYVMPSAQDSAPRPPRPQRRPRVRHSEWSIEGRVINAAGESITGARVFASSDSPTSALVATSFTDEDGNFTIEVQGPGIYTVYGAKETDGYPLTTSGFHQEGVIQIPKVSLEQEQRVVRGIVIQLGLKAGYVEGVISDVATLSRIGKATITLRRADNPELYYMIGDGEEKKNGRFKVLVPTVPFTIEVAAPGYETWTYSMSGRSNDSDPLSVSRGETKQLSVNLRAKKISQ